MKSSKIQQLIIVTAIVASFDLASIAAGQTSTTTTTAEGTKSTTVGTITEYTPDQIVVKTTNGVKHFKISGDSSLNRAVTVGSAVQVITQTRATGEYVTKVQPVPDVAGPDYQPPPKKN